MTRLALALLLWPALAHAEPGRVHAHVDGDTLWIALQGSPVKVRVAGVDSPERAGHALCEAEMRAGEAAATFVRQLLPAGTWVDLRPTGQREKWGRMLASITMPDGRDLATVVIGAGHGVPYAGRGPKAAQQLGLCP